MRAHIALRSDARPEIGTGHVVRSLALGDELVARGHRVTVLGEVIRVPWLEAQLRGRGLAVVPAPADPERLAEEAKVLAIDAVVLDGYHLDRTTGAALRAAGASVLSMIDDTFGGGQEADLYLDQNFGARRRPNLPGEAQLIGLDYALFRDEVLRHRPAAPWTTPASTTPAPMTPPPTTSTTPGTETPRVLAVFGGSDPFGAAPIVVPLLLSPGRPIHVVAVAARADVAASLNALSRAPGQHLEVIAPTPDLAGVASTCDVAVTAAGGSVWEFLCLGVPAALVCVVDNQSVGYDAVTAEGLADPVGHLDALRRDPKARAAAEAVLQRLICDPERRALLSRTGMELVDGRGRSRVADALLGAIAARR